MGIFDELDQAEVFEKSQYFQTGRYIVKIGACKIVQGHNGTSFVVEAIVEGAISGHDKAPSAGETAAHVWNASRTPQKVEQARATWIAFLCAMYGVEKSAYTGPQWKEISEKVMEQNALGGQIAYLECHEIITKKGEPFTVHNWKGAPTPEQLSEFGLAA